MLIMSMYGKMSKKENILDLRSKDERLGLELSIAEKKKRLMDLSRSGINTPISCESDVIRLLTRVFRIRS